MIDTAVQTLLAADATLVAMLGTMPGGEPAIFVGNTIPAQYDRASAANIGKSYVALRDGERGPYLDGDRRFFTQPVDIFVQEVDQGDASHVEVAATRIRDLLDGASIAPAGYTAAGTAIETGPIPEDPDDLTYGRRLRVIVGLIEA